MKRRDERWLGYYVDNYLREEYGTIAQLENGMRNHVAGMRVPDEVINRLVEAWKAMTAEAQNLPDPYRVGGEWASIIGTSFGPLGKAFDDEERENLSSLLLNFFRRFGDFFGEPTDVVSAVVKKHRCQMFRVFASRWIDLYGEESLPEVRNPLIGNPYGFIINGSLFTADGFRHNFYAKRILELISDIIDPMVCEIGGGFGGFAYNLLNRPGTSIRYVNFDLPLICLIEAYYLLTAFPEKRVGLFSEVESISEPFRDHDVVMLPNFVLPYLRDKSMDVCFNSCSFAEMDESTVREYFSQMERVCRKYIMHQNHSWTSGSRNAAYEPGSGFKHWNLSAIEPSPLLFRRLHKIPSPFQGDLYAEFFEWLYVRR